MARCQDDGVKREITELGNGNVDCINGGTRAIQVKAFVPPFIPYLRLSTTFQRFSSLAVSIMYKHARALVLYVVECRFTCK